MYAEAFLLPYCDINFREHRTMHRKHYFAFLDTFAQFCYSRWLLADRNKANQP